MKINLDHVWFMIQRSLQVMLKQPTGGKIITIGSMASYFGCTTVPAYTATKGAVAQLTKSVAVDCAGAASISTASARATWTPRCAPT